MRRVRYRQLMDKVLELERDARADPRELRHEI
jgi:hypothetical protein